MSRRVHHHESSGASASEGPEVPFLGGNEHEFNTSPRLHLHSDLIRTRTNTSPVGTTWVKGTIEIQLPEHLMNENLALKIHDRNVYRCSIPFPQTMPTPPNANFYQVPFEGTEPLGLIAINIGERTSTVTALSLYPGLTPFRFEMKSPVITSVDWMTKGRRFDYGETAHQFPDLVNGFPLHLHPPKFLFPFKPKSISSFGTLPFGRQDLPEDLTIEVAFTRFLSELRSSFDNSLQDFALWNNVKDRARVIFVYPSVWGWGQLRLLRKCIEDAGWLIGEKRELEFVTEEEAMISGVATSFLEWAKPLPIHYVVANECSPTTVAVFSFETERDRPWEGKCMWSRGSCNAGFAVAYEAARDAVSKPDPLSSTIPRYRPPIASRDYNVCCEARKIVKSEGVISGSDIEITKNEGVESLKKSVESLVELLTSSVANMSDDHANTCVILGGNYIGSEMVKKEVHRQLRVSGRGTKCYVLGPANYCGDSVVASEHYTEGGLLFYLISRGLVKSPARKPEIDALKESSIILGDYMCYQLTEEGRSIDNSPPDAIASGTGPQITPPSDGIISTLEEICKSAHVCYSRMEPWQSANTEVRFLAPVVEDMKGCFSSYATFLQDSIESSKSGHSVSAECETVCQTILEGILPEKIQEIVCRSLQTKAKVALEDATRMIESFRTVRVAIIKATEATVSMVTDLREIDAPIGNIKLLDRSKTRSPPSYDFVPMRRSTIPLEKKVTVTPLNPKEANSDLLQVLQTIDLFGEHLNHVVCWWEEVENHLGHLETKAIKMSSRIMKMDLRSCATNWGAIKVAYLNYQQTVTLLLKGDATENGTTAVDVEEPLYDPLSAFRSDRRRTI